MSKGRRNILEPSQIVSNQKILAILNNYTLYFLFLWTLLNSIEHFRNNVKREEVYTRTFSNCIEQYQTVLKT